jgi:hypothetical protein
MDSNASFDPLRAGSVKTNSFSQTLLTVSGSNTSGCDSNAGFNVIFYINIHHKAQIYSIYFLFWSIFCSESPIKINGKTLLVVHWQLRTIFDYLKIWVRLSFYLFQSIVLPCRRGITKIKTLSGGGKK